MAWFKRLAPSISQIVCLPITLQPFSERDRMTIEQVLADVAPEWSVELEGMSEAESSLIVLPEDGDDTFGPSFAISRQDYGLRLDQVHWDEMTEIGVFASMSDLLDAMCRKLWAWSGSPVGPSVMIH